MGSYRELAHDSDSSFLVLNKTKRNIEHYNVLTGYLNRFFFSSFFSVPKRLQSAGPVIKRILSAQATNIDAARHLCVLRYNHVNEQKKNICPFVILRTKREKHAFSSVLP